MKICQILGGNEDGGLEKHTIELSYELQKKDIDVTIIAHEKFREEFKGLKFISLDLTKSRNNVFMLYKLYKILKKENFDIIHSQANKATAIVTNLKRFVSPKIVSTLHSYKKNLSAFKKSDYVITVSNKIGEKLYIKNKVTIYNGIKMEDVNKIDLHERYNIPKDKFIICAVGRLSHVKRFDILISSLQHINNVHLILVGNGKEEESLKKLSNKLNVNNKITFTGSLKNEDAKEIMKASKLFVMTSDKEGFPYTLIETLCCNTVIISTDVSDIRDIIGDNNIIPFNDYKYLSNEINKIKDTYDEVNKEFIPIFNLAQEKFTIEYMTKETIEIYKKVLV
jgi:glycosyltransferase involved in cell wall biosynthesis